MTALEIFLACLTIVLFFVGYLFSRKKKETT